MQILFVYSQHIVFVVIVFFEGLLYAIFKNIQGERKMKKRLYSLISLLLIVCLLLLSSCTQDGEQNSSNGGATNSANAQANERNISSVFLSGGSCYYNEFNDGYAVVKCFPDSESDPIQYIINTEGTICGETSYRIESFENGIAISSDGGVAIDTTGAVIYDAKSKGEGILGSTNEGNLLLYKIENTVNGMSISVCTIDQKGQPVLGWQEINVFTELTSTAKLYAIPLDENIFVIYGVDDYDNGKYSNEAFYFNAETGAYAKSCSTTSWEIEAKDAKFHNGKRVYFQRENQNSDVLFDGWVSVDKNTLKITEIRAGSIHMPNFLSCDYAYSGDNNLLSLAYSSIWETNKIYVGYYDESTLNVKIDLTTKYHKVTFASPFYDGVAVLRICNDAEAQFIAAIDENGNELFTPIEFDGAFDFSKDTIGYVVDNTVHFIDKKSGVEISSTPGVDCAIGSDGIALISTTRDSEANSKHYFDISSGTILFQNA